MYHGGFWFLPGKISGILICWRGIGGGIVLIGPLEFLFAIMGFELGTSRAVVLLSTTVPWLHLAFTSDNFRYIYPDAEGFVVVLF